MPDVFYRRIPVCRLVGHAFSNCRTPFGGNQFHSGARLTIGSHRCHAAAMGQLAGEHLVDHNTERVDIAGDTGMSVELFGSHVVRRAPDFTLEGGVHSVDATGESEVRDFDDDFVHGASRDRSRAASWFSCCRRWDLSHGFDTDTESVARSVLEARLYAARRTGRRSARRRLHAV